MTPAEDPLRRLEALVVSLIQALSDDEAAVHVTLLPEALHTNLTVRVAPRDYGKIVGRWGQNVSALRVILNAVGNKLRLPQCSLFIEDLDRGRRGSEPNGPSPRGARSVRPRDRDLE
jgi:predicted RNA-binding protein YlqC (UPF0109 family)